MKHPLANLERHGPVVLDLDVLEGRLEPGDEVRVHRACVRARQAAIRGLQLDVVIERLVTASRAVVADTKRVHVPQHPTALERLRGLDIPTRAMHQSAWRKRRRSSFSSAVKPIWKRSS